MRHIAIHSHVTLLDAVFPDGTEVAGVWTVIGRHGEELIAECRGTIIRFPEHIARIQREPRPTLVPGRIRKRKAA